MTFQRETKRGKAVENKINTCRTNLSSWENFQIQILGKVVDNSYVPGAVGQATVVTNCSPAQVTPTKQIIGRRSFVPPPAFKPQVMSTTKSMTKDYYGHTSAPHETLHVDAEAGVLTQNFHLFKTNNVVVGDEDAVVTDTLTLTLNSIDERWFTEIKGFNPFKLTQTAADTLVLENPRAHYDFFFAPRLNKENSFDKKDLDTAFLVSDNNQEQIQYELGRKQIVDSKNRNEDWRYRTEMKFKGLVLDYQLDSPEARDGEIPFTFLFAPLPSLKWRIALAPEADKKLRSKEKEEANVADMFDDFKKKRAKLLAKAKQMKDEDDNDGTTY